MDKEKIIEQITLIGTTEDIVKQRELLAEMQEDIIATYESNEKLEKEKSDLIAEKEKLLSANMELFLQVGNKKSNEEVIENKTGIKENPVEKRKFEDLFNEKGELK